MKLTTSVRTMRTQRGKMTCKIFREQLGANLPRKKLQRGQDPPFSPVLSDKHLPHVISQLTAIGLWYDRILCAYSIQICVHILFSMSPHRNKTL
jgi:hypothetical protein